jgi:hypothetical protein
MLLIMKWEEVSKNWARNKAELQTEWGISDGDFELIAGNKYRLLSKLQELFGITREEAEERLKHFLSQESNKNKKKD